MIHNVPMWLVWMAGFAMIALAARQIGHLFFRLRLPLISGFLFTGMVAGPYMLDMISVHAVEKLKFIDELSLAYIAFAAGNELIVRQLKPRFKTIRYNIYGQVVSIFTLGSLTFYFVSEFLPFMTSMSPVHRAAIAIMAGTILVARSPSSAIAVVNELRAKGPFTKTALGVTVIMDALVISLFSVSISVAGAVLSGHPFNFHFILIIFVELSLSVALGCLLGKLIIWILSIRAHKNIKTGMIFSVGYGVFILSSSVRHLTHTHLGVEILLESMLACMIGSFIAANYSSYRTELMKVLHDVGPYVYIAFFTLAGASLQLDVLSRCWAIALLLCGARAAGIFLGAFSGGFMAGEGMTYHRIAWMAYIAQGCVSMGLAKKVGVEFPEWGTTFTTLVLAIAVLNLIAGPPLFKWALHMAGETHPKADTPFFDGIRDTVIFGLDGESLALARLLISNNWEVKIATRQMRNEDKNKGEGVSDIEIHTIPDLSIQTFNKLGVGQADSIVAMLSDEENYRICELIYENYGTRNMIVRLNHREHMKRFHQLGALVVEPSTAIVNLLDQFVRSPSAATLLLGLEKGRDIIEFEMRNPDLQGVAIRDLRLPLDIHILSIRRHGQLIVLGGFTTLRVGDWLTVVGSPTSLEQMMLQCDERRDHEIAHMVGKAASKNFVSGNLQGEVEDIIHEQDHPYQVRFDQLIEESIVLDLEAAMAYELFFHQVSQTISMNSNLEEDTLFQLLMEREKECSTALRPDLAIPHIIIDGENMFFILLARCRNGITFSNLAPKVQAAFVLIGTRDQRDYHLYVLSAIAEIVQQPRFLEKWLRAHNEKALRHIARTRKNR